MSVTVINSATIINGFDQHIKVSAGPGAGKTTWVINHIRNVLNNSDRLKITRKIACITYTNVAVDTIVKRLGDAVHQVEVSTIHSFLYKHVVKPYVHFIAAEHSLDATKLKGHDDTVLVNYSFVNDWKTRTKQQRITDDKKVTDAFKKLKWTILSNGELEVKPKHPVSFGKFAVTTASYKVYKEMTWEKGILHHDDLLYFSYHLIKKFPFILEVLRAKFPYFFIDEFQDISPIQLFILNQLAKKETNICVVGDNAQSIYSFLGALPNQFSGFKLPGIIEYEILDNWRSTEKIVGLLNIIRKDIVQKDRRGIVGTPPVIIIGDKIAALAMARKRSGNPDVYTLSRNNILANAIGKGLSSRSTVNLLNELDEKDSNPERKRAVIACVKAVEYAEQGYYKDALKTISKQFGTGNEKASQKQSLAILKSLVDNKASFQAGKVMDLYNFITANIVKLSKFSGANPKGFYEQYTYSEISTAVLALDEAANHRTIHKAKGDEFDAVLLVIDGDKKGKFDEAIETSFLLTPDLNQEEHRIRYVALSRAMNHLFINFPTISPAIKLKIENLGLEVV